MPPGSLENFFALEDKNLEKKIAIAVEKIYLRSLWFTKDRRKHNSEGSRGHIYYGRFCTRELLWYHDVLLGQPQNDMQSSLLNNIELIWRDKMIMVIFLVDTEQEEKNSTTISLTGIMMINSLMNMPGFITL